jgi:sigma-E factor negative regulatory protein RseB
MKLLSTSPLFIFLFSFFATSPALSQNETSQQETPQVQEAKKLGENSAKIGLEKLSLALKNLNFSTSFVVVKNNQAEPYHWLHGIGSQDQELTVLSRLNGPRRDILQIGQVVSYIEPEHPQYSVYAKSIKGPIPSIFSGDINRLSENYHFVLVGKSRVLGRAAQLIRIVPKDPNRLGYWLWQDLNSNLLLKLAILSEKGQMLEQIQFTHLDITEKLSVNLAKLQETQLPNLITLDDTPHQKEGNESANDHKAQFNWEVNWLPSGFKLVNTNDGSLDNSKNPIRSKLFSDGLVDISVYIGPALKNQQPIGYVNDGATVVLTKTFNQVEVSVVGKIPANTAVRIADSVSVR